ncbi:MAG: Na+/H+ antiporter subunit E [Candidatus Omnitrophota bacterium]
MKSKILLFLCGMIVWSLLNWVPDAQHLIVGAIVSALAAFMTGDLFVKRVHLFKHAYRYLWFLYYVPLFIWECFKANIDVACRVLHPDLPIHPGIVKVNTTLTSDIALTFLANSITLTPGTLTVDIDKPNGALYVHWIEVKERNTEKATKVIVEKFEKILKRIFEE